MIPQIRIESLLSARLFLNPERCGDRLYFISNLSGRLSLYSMVARGGIPQPLLPPHLALQNPALLDGIAFRVLPSLGRILVVLDHDGDERYQPVWVPLEGGWPEPVFGDRLARYRVHVAHCDAESGIAWLAAEASEASRIDLIRADLNRGTLETIHSTRWMAGVAGSDPAGQRAFVVESYAQGDTVLHLWQAGRPGLSLLHGTPIEQRQGTASAPMSGIGSCHFVEAGQGVLFVTALFEDCYGLAWMPADGSKRPERVRIDGVRHEGPGEFEDLEAAGSDRFLARFNVNGSSWLYLADYEPIERVLRLGPIVAGDEPLAAGVVQSCHHDRATGELTLAFSSASSPVQIAALPAERPRERRFVTSERLLGIPPAWLSGGEDASFHAEDGLRIHARLYRPAPALGFVGPRPLIVYIHGGPQSQERPDFTWFSMPLIQLLALSGFAVFVPNTRGSSGFGIDYCRRVDRDWGGLDRLDHVRGVEVLGRDKDIDISRAGVVGRSYGGYMTLTLAARHPRLFRAAVDMFGPYDLPSFLGRIPEAWKPYFDIALGHPVRDREFLIERSPRTWLEDLICPLFVIQGRNDPRVVAAESEALVADLRTRGKDVEFLVFEDEGHDVLKQANRVRCYDAIRDFFARRLGS